MTVAQIATVRERINQFVNEAPFTDTRVQEAVDSHDGDLDLAAAELWRVKAAGYADLADVQEGSSRRTLSGLYQQAIKMAEMYESRSATPVVSSGLRPGRTRQITRP